MSGRTISRVKRGTKSRVRRESQWLRIEREIQREIDDRVLHPHDRLQSEKTLAMQYGVGLHDVRKALKSLQAKGSIYAKVRSGMYVAEAVAGVQEPAIEEGFHAFDISQGAVCHLKFLVTGWTTRSKAMWERLCRNASAIHPTLSLEPLFPRTAEDFNLLFPRCDLSILSVSDRLLLNGNRRAALLDRSDIAGLSIADRYVAAASAGGDKFLGVPLSGTFLVGGIQEALTPPPVRRMLAGARSWRDVVGILERSGKGKAAYFNLHPFYTLNLMQHLFHVGGSLVDPKTRKIKIGNPAFREELDYLDSVRGQVFRARDPVQQMSSGECRVFLEWTYLFHRNPSFAGLKPWLFPLGSQGKYLEGLNVCVISQDSHHPAECRKILHYLLSDPVQREIGQLSGEHSVSGNSAHRFEGYQENWRPTLSEMHERSQVFCEVVPGYIDFLHTVVHPLTARFYLGRITASELVEQVTEKGKSLQHKI